MPKQEFINGVMRISEDVNDPHDKLKVLERNSKGKNPKALTDKEKIEFFDAYIDAGIIKL